ncbi:GGDEF domain-containing protein [Mesorhizobium sp. CAU 1741]|uniref:GGDEF domain-containing protein n=1 Tax=Mesorhizobium sp. CAU 1741 TaxID=3140366 RepID=UPI00325BD04C
MSKRGRLKMAAWTLFGTLGCLCVSLTYNWIAFRDMAPEAMRQGLISATVLPILLATPLFFYLTLKLRELAIVNHRLNDLASHDSLTGCLNRRAFTTLVERRLAEDMLGKGSKGGALLVADADHFKSINDRFGHHQGDQALKAIGDAIRSVLRSSDVVGRLGGEEFGIHLPGADWATARMVGERVRVAVSRAGLPVGDLEHRLSVSVGCVVYSGQTSFRELFCAADQRLYAAKHHGRDRVEIAAAPSLAPELGDLIDAN